jgi:hypothetical protein
MDSTSAVTKSADVLLSRDAHLLILDDTPAVWPNHLANLIVARDPSVQCVLCCAQFC